MAIRLKPPMGSTTLQDWIGRRVKSTLDLRNELVAVPAGSLGTVIDWRTGRGLRVQFDSCTCCGVSAVIASLENSCIEEIPTAQPITPVKG